MPKLIDIRLLLFIPMIIMMYIIYSFSAKEGPESSSLSLEVTTDIVETIDTVIYNDNLNEQTYSNWVNKLHLPVRKCAHMCEYALLTLLGFMPLFAYSIRYTISHYIIPISISFMYACTDELHQRFISQRSGQFKDVCVDMCGVLIMTILLYFLCKIIKNMKISKKS